MSYLKKRTYIIVALLLITGIIIGVISIKKKAIDDSYNYAITLIANKSYEDALLELEKANPDKIERDDFLADVTYGKQTAQLAGVREHSGHCCVRPARLTIYKIERKGRSYDPSI